MDTDFDFNKTTAFNWDQESREVRSLGIKIASLKDGLEREQTSLESASSKEEHTRQAQEVLQVLAQAVQQQAHDRIAKVVSTCLSTVFDDPYEFHIQFERRRGRTEAELRFRRRGLDVDPLTAAGGGVVDVAAFALRIACLVMHRPRLSPVIVLDEPFRFVSAQYQESVRVMLEQLSSEMGVQIIFVTHNDNLATGKIIDL